MDPWLVLLIGALLVAMAMAALGWRVQRLESSTPERLIGELRLAQWSAVWLAGLGGLTAGVAAAGHAGPAANLDIAFGVGFVIAAGLIIQSEPRRALSLVTVGFVVQALELVAHRPGWLTDNDFPISMAIGAAACDVWLAAVCVWARRR